MEPNIQVLYEGENFAIYRIEDEDGSVGYDLHILDTLTVHLIEDEWNEFLDIMQNLED
jgi:hypothetical protein